MSPKTPTQDQESSPSLTTNSNSTGRPSTSPKLGKTYTLRHSVRDKKEGLAKACSHMDLLKARYAGVKKALGPALREFKKRQKAQLGAVLETSEVVAALFSEIKREVGCDKVKAFQQTTAGEILSDCESRCPTRQSDRASKNTMDGLQQLVGTIAVRASMISAIEGRDIVPLGLESRIESVDDGPKTITTAAAVNYKGIRQTKWSKRGNNFIPHGLLEARAKSERKRLRQDRAEIGMKVEEAKHVKSSSRRKTRKGC